MDTQTQIDRLIELAIVQRSELKQLVSELPQLREYLGAEIERTFEEAEPQIRTELEEFCRARATDEHAKTGAALAAKVEQLSKQLEVTTAAKYSVLMAERAENANLLAKAEARIEDAASMLTHAVKEIVTDELSRFPRAGEIDQLRKEFAEPRGLNPRGRWMPDETYQRLDLVTINGDSFVSNIDGNRERPSRTAGDWTLSAARGNGGGGGGVTTMTDLVPVPTDGQLLIGNGAAFVNATLTAGTGISISNGPGSITINATDGNITLDDGTAAAPSLNFTNEPTTGLFRASANVMGFAVAGTSRATMTATGMTVTGTITPTGSVHAAAGSLGNPSIAFNADQNTGLYNIGADNIGVVANGAKVLDIATTGLGVTGTLSVSGVATLGAGAILNTPASGTLTNATGLPISTGVSGLGTGVATFLATPSSANLLAAVTNETGTGALVFGTSPTLTTPISATLTSPAATNLTLAGGSSGASLVLGQGAAGSATITTTGAGVTQITSALLVGQQAAIGASLDVQTASGTAATLRLFQSGVSNWVFSVPSATDALVLSQYGTNEAFRISNNRNLLIGTTTDAASLAGGLVINGSGAGAAASSTTTGALRVTGGVGVSGAGYFGGAVVLLPSSGTARGRINNDPVRADVFNVGGNWNGASQDDNTKPSWFAQIDGRAAGDSYSIQRAAPAGAPTAILSASATGVINIPATTSASSSTVGALTIGNGTAATNVAIGGGKVNIGDTTAGSSGAGALVVAGGLATGAASYFGGAVTVTTVNATTAAGGFTMSQSTVGEVSVISARNTNAGTDASVRILLGNNLSASAAQIQMYGSNDSTNPNVFRVGTSTSGTTMIGTINNATITTTSSTGFAISSGLALKLGNAYVAGAVVGTGSITIQDSTGTTYRIPVLV